MSQFPFNKKGTIVDYDTEQAQMPIKIIEMGLLPGTEFTILYQAPFNGPFYIEYGVEKSRIALRKEEAEYLIVE